MVGCSSAGGRTAARAEEAVRRREDDAPQMVGIRGRHAIQEIADDRRCFGGAVASERCVDPARWEEDVTCLLKLWQERQGRVDVVDGRRGPQRVVQIAEPLQYPRLVTPVRDVAE